ncbi:MAG: hypothetical protein OES15_06945 [Nitrosopumilus sp.]|nr:hypothetical protein [Nitrosopumilus sp.]MDH3853660.1 hypothetical protein [Nitrosopumilus sp.]
MVFGSIAPAFADSDGKSYKRWVVPIDDAVGTIEISEDTNIDDVRDSAISEEQARQGYDVDKAKLKKAVNDSGQYFLVWKLIDYTESDTKIMYILDAGTGEQLTEPITKEKGSCGKHKTTGENA